MKENKVINPYDGKEISIKEMKQIEKDLKDIMNEMYERKEINNDTTRK